MRSAFFLLVYILLPLTPTAFAGSASSQMMHQPEQGFSTRHHPIVVKQQSQGEFMRMQQGYHTRIIAKDSESNTADEEAKKRRAKTQSLKEQREKEEKEVTDNINQAYEDFLAVSREEIFRDATLIAIKFSKKVIQLIFSYPSCTQIATDRFNSENRFHYKSIFAGIVYVVDPLNGEVIDYLVDKLATTPKEFAALNQIRSSRGESLSISDGLSCIIDSTRTQEKSQNEYQDGFKVLANFFIKALSDL